MFMMIGIVVIGSYFCLAALRGIFSQPLRNGYTEVFYPVSNLFIGYLTGIWFLMLYFLNNNVLNGSKYVRSLGQVSLPVYFFHTAFISYLLPIFSQSETDFDWKVFSAGLGSFYAGIFLLSALLVKYKSALKNGKLRMIGQLIGI
jgi:fucose 4-O-acetylase-like acetyltransferase